MTELRHIIHELRTFDSMSTKEKIDQLAVKCDQLKVKLTKRNTDLRRALMRVSELENKVNSKLSNGSHRSPHEFHEFKQCRPFYNSKIKQSSGDESFTIDEGRKRNCAKGNVRRQTKKTPVVEKNGKIKRRNVIIPGISINGQVQEEPRQFVFELRAEENDASETSEEIDGFPLPGTLLSVDSLELDRQGAETDACLSDGSWESD
ncbi:uncharacterized protein LOC117106355 [Anneissia japonica]|uniref:uncharacterized protein LOC117106355 n=1 Tax=Anneissia japonica TaxID=1529436 RepID=UPI001425A55F|nr:uncharacterized protein LOC117106355 [Anneissia japonica]